MNAEEEKYPDSSTGSSLTVQIAAGLDRLCGLMQMPANARPLRNSAASRPKWSHLPSSSIGRPPPPGPRPGPRAHCLRLAGVLVPLASLQGWKEKDQGTGLTPPADPLPGTALAGATSLELLSAQSRNPPSGGHMGQGELGWAGEGQSARLDPADPRRRPNPGNVAV